MKDLNNISNYSDTESIINYYNRDFNKDINKYFKRSSIIDLVTKYELYYHISLSNYAFETLLDLNETAKKLQELNLYVTPEVALFNIYNIIKENKEDKDLEKKLEVLIREKASLQALDDFVRADKEFLGAKYYLNNKKEAILNDNFYDENMRINFEANYQKTFEHYNLMMNDKFIEEIQSRILN